ncbi:uncharacterized protein [Parasteatoda tepidariorum]|uniref:uncharacterized protein n=1 Tax=Parasteatoda tepidariorum TaxID=114398 RepID=UPI00077FBD22|nr:uncharacterized protein LOC107453155 [Parasteatoda tepidariorum]
MPCNIFRSSPRSSFSTATYVSGMILVILGIGSITVSIDPRPFSRSSWTIFLVIGLFLIASGSLLLVLVSKIKAHIIDSPNRIAENDTINSAADLLDDNLYDEIDGASHVAYQNTVESLESVRAVSQCMMTRSESPRLFFKETFV